MPKHTVLCNFFAKLVWAQATIEGVFYTHKDPLNSNDVDELLKIADSYYSSLLYTAMAEFGKRNDENAKDMIVRKVAGSYPETAQKLIYVFNDHGQGDSAR